MENDQPRNAQHHHCLVYDFCLLLPEQPLQHAHVPRPQTVTPGGSAKHLGMHHKTHTLTTRYGNHDMENVLAPQDSAPLDHVPPDHTLPGASNESSNKYSAEMDTCHPSAELLEQFWQHQDQSTTSNLLPTHLHTCQSWCSLQINCNTLLWQSNPQPNKEPLHKICRHAWKPCKPCRENQTSQWPSHRIFQNLMDRTSQS